MSKKPLNQFPATPAHAIFQRLPLRYFEVKVSAKRKAILVVTDFPLTRENSKAYSAEITAHVLSVEAALSKPRRKVLPASLFYPR